MQNQKTNQSIPERYYPLIKKGFHKICTSIFSQEEFRWSLTYEGCTTILINHYCTKHNPKLLSEVYGHELAHFMATHGDGNSSHSGTWVDYMKCMGLPVRDNVPISPELAQWGYVAIMKCSCGTLEIHKSKIEPPVNPSIANT